MALAEDTTFNFCTKLLTKAGVVGLTGQKPPKLVLRSVRHLAKQLARLHARHEKRTTKAVLPPGQQKLTDKLVVVLDAHFAQDVLAAPETALLTETAEKLAAKLTKIRAPRAKKDRQVTAESTPSLPPS